MTSPTPAPGAPSSVLTLRIPDVLLSQLTAHAARRGLPLQDYVLRLLAREDFDERLREAVQRSAALAAWGPPHGS
ncbi:hypothetical protein ACFV5N_02325 [Streptomyces sp. NPDC059853]|uniref:hypothetical protein n=1 Tax=Streptomyces sp. NPDC059853 TaxID=3346973 RepID=UPI003660727C